MMPRLLLFNPGHEESLRHLGQASYTPARTVRQMMNELYPLMTLMARAGDYIARLDESWTRLTVYTHDLDEVNDLSALPELMFSPWALDPFLITRVRRLAEACALRLVYPEVQDAYIRLSHRSATVDLLAHLGDRLPMLHLSERLTPLWLYAGNSLEETATALATLLANHAPQLGEDGDEIVVKRPFTSSGRGVQPYTLPLGVEAVRILVGTLHREGAGISFEPRLAVGSQWASLFEVERSGVRYHGLSHFETAGAGSTAYNGNVLASQDELHARLSAEADLSAGELAQIIDAQRAWLASSLVGQYLGYVGIDMFTYRDEAGAVHLHPAVEVNVRCTMGVLAGFVYERYLPEGAHGTFRLEHSLRHRDELARGQVIELTPSSGRFFAYAEIFEQGDKPSGQLIVKVS